jgi:hypothetical protein
MEEAGWSAQDYLWDPYRLMAVEGTSAAALHAATQELGAQPDSLVAPVLPGPAVPSAAASRANNAKCKVLLCCNRSYCCLEQHAPGSKQTKHDQLPTTCSTTCL